MGGTYKIEDNLFIKTTDKRANRVVFVEGHYWIEPKEEFDTETMKAQIGKLIDSVLPKYHITILEMAVNGVVQGKRSCFSFQVHFRTDTKKDFNTYCRKITPLILLIKPRFLRVFSENGFGYHLTKKGAI